LIQVCPPFQFDHEPPLQCNETKETTGQLNGDQTRKCEELEVKTPESSFSQKRKARVGSAEVRHREKMARQDRFNVM
jgi:hypothetical protein